MAWGEVVSAAKQGVIDGGDLPIVNIDALKIYEVAQVLLADLSQLRPDRVVTMNLEFWNGLSDAHKKLMLDVGRETQDKIREHRRIGRQFRKGQKRCSSRRGMTVAQGNVEAFRKVAQEKIWPAYKTQFGALWEEIAGFKS